MVTGSELLPPAYASYRALLAESLVFFLDRLPPHRLRPIWREQMALGEEAPLVERLVALMHHLPTLHKLGQVVSRERRLQPELRSRLQRLESLVPRTPQSVVQGLLDRELPEWSRRGVHWVGQPIAEGSVAVVVPFAWRAPGASASSRGVLKMLLPGIEGRLAEDLEIWSQLGVHLEETCARHGLPALDYRETFDTVRDLLQQEVHLDQEQAHMESARALLRGLEQVRVPELLPFCTPRMTAMTFIGGRTLTQRLQEQSNPEADLAVILAEALLIRPLLSNHHQAIIHGDPHAGNIMVTPERHLALLDWSLAAHLSKPDRAAFGQLLLGTTTLDAVRMAASVESLLMTRPDPVMLREVMELSLREIRWGICPGVAWLTRMLDEVVFRTGARFRSEWMVFRKCLFTVERVLGDLLRQEDASGNPFLDRLVWGNLARQFWSEWPDRWRRPLDTPAWSSHVSTQDLLWCWWSAPATWTRYWAGWWGDVMGSVVESGKPGRLTRPGIGSR